MIQIVGSTIPCEAEAEQQSMFLFCRKENLLRFAIYCGYGLNSAIDLL
jgi:hypothetical protein